MHTHLIDILACPRCRNHPLEPVVTARDAHEIREGFVFCAGCGSSYPLHAGVLDMLADPPPAVLAEAAGWSQLLGATSPDLDEHMLALPYLPDPSWQEQAANFDGLLSNVDVYGKRVIDLGSGRAWSARRLAERGAQVVATDIVRQRYIGLETAELFLGRNGVFFERVLADMGRLPFVDQSFDIAFGTAAFHHALDLQTALHEAARVLRTGGYLLLSNEPVHPDGVQADLHASTEVHHGINEQTYSFAEWLAMIVAAGLAPHLLLPRQVLQAYDNGWLSLHRTLLLRPARDYLPALLHTSTGRRMLSQQPALHAAYDDYGFPLVLIARKHSAGTAPRQQDTTLRQAIVRRALAAAARPDPTLHVLSPIELVGAATMGLYPAEGVVHGRPWHWTGSTLQLNLTRPAGAAMVQLLMLFPPVDRVISLRLDGEHASLQHNSLRSLPARRWMWRRLNIEIPPDIGERFRLEIAVDSPWQPADAGIGPDTRDLGIGVAQVGFVSPRLAAFLPESLYKRQVTA